MHDGSQERAVSAWVSDWVVAFAAPCYGPFGGTKVIEHPDGSVRVLASGASALRDAEIVHADLQPYVDLAAAVQEHAGDQATTALLLAARLVGQAYRALDDGVPATAFLDGYALALRQARAEIAALARRDPTGLSLASVVPHHRDVAPLVLQGLRELGKDRPDLPLEAVELRAEPADAPAWLPGVVVDPKFQPRTMPSEARVLLLTEDWKPGPWKEGIAYRMTAKHELGAWAAAEDARRDAALRHLQAIGANLVVCLREVDPEVAERAGLRGIAVHNDASLGALVRLESATGARRVSHLMDATAADLGRARLEPDRRRGYLAVGAGPAATFVLPASNQAARDQAKDDGERLLRAAGALLSDLHAVPGGGRWQRAVAASIRKAADAAPGKAPFALHAAARAVDAVADDLVRNAGKDPTRTPLLADAEQVWDPAMPVRVAVAGAFEMAMQVLRIDARYRRRASSGTWLAGGDKVPGPESGLPGDVPPLM